MNRIGCGQESATQRSRGLCRLGAVLALLSLVLVAGCGDELEREFRQAAIDGLETGLRGVADGLLDGLFAIADPDNGSATTTSGS